MRTSARYGEPFFWWGPRWESPAARGLRELLQGGTIDPWIAAHLWAALARRRSLAVVAGPSGVGKTTLLTALCELLPPETRRIYLRGCFENFAFLDDPAVDPRQSVLLVNELSPHLPVYLWGPGVAAALSARRRGFTLLATAHAATAVEFVGSLAGSPLRLPPDLIAGFDHVVAIDVDATNPGQRRVTGLWRLQATRSGIAVTALRPDPSKRSRELTEDDPWFPRDEIALRRRLLTSFAAGNEPELPVVRILPEEEWGALGGAAP